MFTWDEAKRQRNREKHGIDFAEAEHFDLADAFTFPDDRMDYGEVREIAIGFLSERPRTCLHAPRRRHPGNQPAEGQPSGDAAI